jgi:hypothetical protein
MPAPEYESTDDAADPGPGIDVVTVCWNLAAVGGNSRRPAGDGGTDGGTAATAD